MEIFIHHTAEVSEKASIGRGTKIWNQAQVREGAVIGENCILSKNVYIDEGVHIGDRVKIQNNVNVYHGVTVEDDVFLGPSMTFTNDLFPRAFSKDWKVYYTKVKRGASIGANATIVCGHEVGNYAMVGAGSVVTGDVPDHALVAGNPARQIGWVCKCGNKLDANRKCTECGQSYKLINDQLEKETEPKMRVVFLGASAYGVKCLQAVLKMAEPEIVGIMTTPREFVLTYNAGKDSRTMKNDVYEEIYQIGKDNKIPVFVISKMNEGRTVDMLLEWKPELIVVSGWYHIIGETIRNIPKHGVVGLHSSLLPKYRGAAPLVWQMINGENKAGITLFYMDQGVDSGDIIAQAEEIIEETDTIATLYEKIGNRGIELLEKYLPLIALGKAPRIKQEHLNDGDVWPQRRPEDGLIDWSRSPREIENFVRAQTKPYPGAYTVIDGKKVTIWDCTVEENRN